MSRSRYRRYPTGLKLQYAAGGLPRTATRTISRSTRQRWKGFTADSFFMPPGVDVFDSESAKLTAVLIENSRLKQLLRAAICLIAVYRNLLAYFSVNAEHVMAVKHTLQRLMIYSTENGFISQLTRLLPFSAHQWAAWNSRKVCQASLVNLCRRKHPHQLSSAEVAVIKEATADKEYQHWPLSSLYYQLMREEKLHCSLSTFYKYCRLLGVTRSKKAHPKKREPLKAAGALSMLHMDITLFRTADGVKHYLYVIRDNYSRAILACKAALIYSSQIAKETLHEVLTRHALLEQEGTLVTDGGPENEGAVTEWLARPGVLWKKVIAQLDIVQSNSMVEAANKIIKHRYLYRQLIANTGELVKILPEVIADCNQMPAACLFGLTPDEVLAGAVPDKEKWREKIITARKKRLANNQKAACENTCSSD